MTSQLRIPPQNIDAEQALLGSILLRPEAITNIADELTVEAFYVKKHQTLYRAMLDLHFADEPIDTLTIGNKLNATGDFAKIGGNNFLLDLTNAVPTSTNAEYYAKVVEEAHTRRQLISTGDYLTTLGFDETQQLEEVIDQAEKRVFSVTQNQTGNTVHKIGDILPQTFESIERLSQSPDGIRGVPTGFKDIDYKLSGLQKADLIILAARPSMGKTSLALDIARKSAIEHKTKTLIFSLEMSAQSLVDRLVSAESHVDLRKIKTGKNLTEQDFKNMREAMGRLNDATIHIDDQAGNNILRMRATARRMAAKEGLDLIVIDYLQLMTTSRHIDNIVQQVSEISRSLKGLGRELDVPVLSLSQLSRAVESRGGKPRLSDLRDSGAIEQDADVVMFIHREADEENGGKVPQTELLIEKHRNGATGKVDLYFEGSRTSFISVEKTDYSSYGVDTSQEDVYA